MELASIFRQYLSISSTSCGSHRVHFVIADIFICLDNDAQDDALVLYDKIKSYVKSVKNIKLDDKDPGEISFQNILKYQKNSVTLSWESVLKEKLSNLSASFLK